MPRGLQVLTHPAAALSSRTPPTESSSPPAATVPPPTSSSLCPAEDPPDAAAPSTSSCRRSSPADELRRSPPHLPAAAPTPNSSGRRSFPPTRDQFRVAGRMFVLSQIEHNLPMPPSLLSRPLIDAIKSELERLFLDKVVANLGLCVSVYDIRAVEGGFVFPGEGCSTYKVSFRLLMFRPFTGEVLVGKISGYDEKGLQVSLDFFSDICIPAHLMQFGTVRGGDGRWMLKTEDGDELYLDIDDEIRFLVSSIKYPPIPVEQKEDDKPFAPMQINGSIKGDGLGLLAWWVADEEEAEEDADAEAEAEADAEEAQ